MLAYFFEVRETGFLSLENGAHSSQSRPLETFAAIKRVTVLDHANHVASNLVDQGAGRVDLAESEFVMIAIVESVAEIGVEGMNVIQARKLGQDLTEAFRNGLLRKLDLSHAIRSWVVTNRDGE